MREAMSDNLSNNLNLIFGEVMHYLFFSYFPEMRYYYFYYQ